MPPRDRGLYQAYLGRLRSPTYEGFLILSEGRLVGVINVSEIVRGHFQSAFLGFYAFAPHQGQGYMSEGLRLVVAEMFKRRGLHRLEANIQPVNSRSIALVKRLGFRLEGYSPRYLKISGRWRDHERWAITSEDWRGSRPSRSRR
jgi:ribosomal-protein-alanine N-acetyltransferase